MLADAAEAGSGDKIVHFSDPDIEHSQVLERFLHLAIYGQLSATAPEKTEYCTDVARLVGFMAKYECARLMPQLQLCLQQHLDDRAVDPAQVFAIASVANSTYICVKALEKMRALTTSALDTPTRRSVAPGPLDTRCPMNPGTVSLEVAQVIHPHYAWAWSRAWALAFWSSACAKYAHHYCKRDLCKVVAEFKIAMESLESTPQV